MVSWNSPKRKKGHFLYRLFCPKGIFLRCVLSQCLVYWIQFQNTYFYISKNITSNTFVAFKIADRFYLKFITVLHQFMNISHKGCSYGGELARLGGLAHLDEMTFISRSYGIFYLSSIKKFVMSLKKDCLIK